MERKFKKKPGAKRGNAKRSPHRSGSNKRKKEEQLDPSLFVKKAVKKAEEMKYESDRTYDAFELVPILKKNIKDKKYSKPTQIQDGAIEPILEGKDLLGIAQTGTGKTAAFLIPLINRFFTTRKHFRAIIIVPTRELALQIEEEFVSLTKGMRLNSVCFIGGTNINRDLRVAPKHFDLLIGTPGRINDLADRGVLKMSNFQVLVLDEFDRLLDMGFKKDLNKIVNNIGDRDQTLLFSATIEKEQQKLIDELLHYPEEVRVSRGDVTGDHIEQNIVEPEEGQSKINKLIQMVMDDSFSKVIVFAETKRWVNTVAKKLNQAGIDAGQIHGDKSQNYRVKALKAFKDGKVKVLVATDVASRGLDISEVTHVINYHPPRSYDSYIHRIGRTGRAGKGGMAFTFIT